MQELDDIKEDKIEEQTPEPHFLDKEDMDSESILEEEKKSLKWVLDKLQDEDVNLKKKLVASEDVQKIGNALEDLESKNPEANAIIEEAKTKLSEIPLNDEDEESLTVGQMSEKQNAIQYKIKTASERLSKLEADLDEAPNEILESSKDLPLKNEGGDDSNAGSINEQEQEKPQKSLQDLDSSKANPTAGSDKEENIKPTQASMTQKGLPVVKNVGEGIVLPAKKPNPEEENTANELSKEVIVDNMDTESSNSNEIETSQSDEDPNITTQDQEMSEAEKIVQEREALFLKALADLNNLDSPEGSDTTLNEELPVETEIDHNQLNEIDSTASLSDLDLSSESSLPNLPVPLNPPALPVGHVKNKQVRFASSRKEKLKKLMNLSYKISGKKTKSRFISPSNAISNQIKTKNPIKRMEEETIIRAMEPVDITQPESHLVTVTCRPDTKKLVSEVAEELGLSSNELLDRGISAVCRMILRNNGRVTFPIEVQQIDLGD